MGDLKVIPTAIEWPTFRASGFIDPITGEKKARSFTLRYTYTTEFLLTKWGCPLGIAKGLELAAAMAGAFAAPGQWRSEGFERAVDLADMMEKDDESAMMEAVLTALKNRFPQAEFSAQPQAGIPAPTNQTKDESETPSSEPGLSQPAPAA